MIYQNFFYSTCKGPCLGIPFIKIGKRFDFRNSVIQHVRFILEFHLNSLSIKRTIFVSFCAKMFKKDKHHSPV